MCYVPAESRRANTLTGVPLKALLQEADASLLESATQVVARAIDGYSVA